MFALLALTFVASITLLQINRFLKTKAKGIMNPNANANPNPTLHPLVKEGFVDADTSAIQTTIRAALDPYLNDDLCSIYTELRSVVGQMIQGNALQQTPDTVKKVEAYLTTNITLPPLPCPAFAYPNGTDADWLTFLNEIPPDIGARFVLMIVYAQRELAFRVKSVKTVIAGGTPLKEEEKDMKERLRLMTKSILASVPTEGFAPIIGICPMSVQDTRRMEKAGQSCAMPEDLTEEEQIALVNRLVQTIEGKRQSILAEKYISPTLDLQAFLKDAKASSEYLKTMRAKAEDGSLAMEGLP